jgi:hypothetical protein
LTADEFSRNGKVSELQLAEGQGQQHHEKGKHMTSTSNPQATNTALLESTLKSTVASSWSELTLGKGLVHVEYQTGADGELDFIKIWASEVWGEWKLICELWMRPLWSHLSGVHFGSEFHSTDFARTLELAVGSVDATNMLPKHRGLVQVFPPSAAEQNEAGATNDALKHPARPSQEQPAAA